MNEEEKPIDKYKKCEKCGYKEFDIEIDEVKGSGGAKVAWVNKVCRNCRYKKGFQTIK